eukprot:PLAT12514.1.p1 GENE.PLAT12514.1~~PLAT12514.1.p1  ORF type:complete len:1026 (+),score=298.58 PLAT12514.1:285-3080(+)
MWYGCGDAALACGAEVVALLRSLLRAQSWKRRLLKLLENALVEMTPLLVSEALPVDFAVVQRCYASLAVLGGLPKLPRVGARVQLNMDLDRAGTIVQLLPNEQARVSLGSGSSGTRDVALSQLKVVEEVSVPDSVLAFSPDVLMFVQAVLSPIVASSERWRAVLELAALRMLATAMARSEGVRVLLDSGLVPSVLSIAMILREDALPTADAQRKEAFFTARLLEMAVPTPTFGTPGRPLSSASLSAADRLVVSTPPGGHTLTSDDAVEDAVDVAVDAWPPLYSPPSEEDVADVLKAHPRMSKYTARALLETKMTVAEVKSYITGYGTVARSSLDVIIQDVQRGSVQMPAEALQFISTARRNGTHGVRAVRLSKRQSRMRGLPGCNNGVHGVLLPGGMVVYDRELGTTQKLRPSATRYHQSWFMSKLEGGVDELADDLLATIRSLTRTAARAGLEQLLLNWPWHVPLNVDLFGGPEQFVLCLQLLLSTQQTALLDFNGSELSKKLEKSLVRLVGGDGDGHGRGDGAGDCAGDGDSDGAAGDGEGGGVSALESKEEASFEEYKGSESKSDGGSGEADGEAIGGDDYSEARDMLVEVMVEMLLDSFALGQNTQLMLQAPKDRPVGSGNYVSKLTVPGASALWLFASRVPWYPAVSWGGCRPESMQSTAPCSWRAGEEVPRIVEGDSAFLVAGETRGSSEHPFALYCAVERWKDDAGMVQHYSSMWASWLLAVVRKLPDASLFLNRPERLNSLVDMLFDHPESAQSIMPALSDLLWNWHEFEKIPLERAEQLLELWRNTAITMSSADMISDTLRDLAGVCIASASMLLCYTDASRPLRSRVVYEEGTLLCQMHAMINFFNNRAPLASSVAHASVYEQVHCDYYFETGHDNDVDVRRATATAAAAAAAVAAVAACARALCPASNHTHSRCRVNQWC